jgi:predicted acetyltransferase
MDAFTLRTLTDDDMPGLRWLDDVAFGGTVADARWAVTSARLERDRQLGAFEGGRLVGHAGVFTQQVTLPGGAAVPAAGVTWVQVLPDRRRRGVLTLLMDHQLRQLRDEAEPLGLLWASEPGIYGRFGYGRASRHLLATVPRDTAWRLPKRVHEAVGSVHVELRPMDEATLALVTACYERARPTRPGMLSRSPANRAEAFDDPPDARGGASALRVMLGWRDATGSAGAPPDAYAVFRTNARWDRWVPQGEATVLEAIGTDAVAEAAVLRATLEVDLMASVGFRSLPVDSPLLSWLPDTRRSRPLLLDQLWARLVRVDDALRARRLSQEIDLVLDVRDERCPWNAGRWRVAGGPTAVEVTRTHEAADLTLDVATLAAAHLGDPVLAPAHRAGLVEEHWVGAVAQAHAAWTSPIAPWCPYTF